MWGIGVVSKPGSKYQLRGFFYESAEDYMAKEWICFPYRKADRHTDSNTCSPSSILVEFVLISP